MGPDIFLIMYVCLAFELMEIKKANEKKKIGFGKGWCATLRWPRAVMSEKSSEL